MSFDNHSMSYVHLVSYPSTWLPDAHTIKILVLGAHEENLQEITDLVQVTWPHQSWAFYHVLDFDITDATHMDWLIINAAHCHACVGFATHEHHMLMCHMMKARVISSSIPEHLMKLFHLSKHPHAPLLDVLTEALKNLHTETDS